MPTTTMIRWALPTLQRIFLKCLLKTKITTTSQGGYLGINGEKICLIKIYIH